MLRQAAAGGNRSCSSPTFACEMHVAVQSTLTQLQPVKVTHNVLGSLQPYASHPAASPLRVLQ